VLTEILLKKSVFLSLALLIAISSVCTIQAQNTDSLVLNITRVGTVNSPDAALV